MTSHHPQSLKPPNTTPFSLFKLQVSDLNLDSFHSDLCFFFIWILSCSLEGNKSYPDVFLWIELEAC